MGKFFKKVSVEDELPDEQWYGIVNQYGVCRQAYYSENNKNWTYIDGVEADVTHWLKETNQIETLIEKYTAEVGRLEEDMKNIPLDSHDYVILAGIKALLDGFLNDLKSI